MDNTLLYDKDEKVAFYEAFTCVFQKNGLEKYVAEPIMEAFWTLTKQMLAVNEVMNLTAITAVNKVVPLHYADCAFIADYVPEYAAVADVGCGGGFPTLPLAILRPDVRITAIDSTAKKVEYVKQTAGMLDLSNVCTVTARAEDLCRDRQYRESFDVVTSRAVARLNMLDELCLPLCRQGGKLLLLKGAAGQDELDEACTGIRRLGGGDPICDALTLNMLDGYESRTIISISKVSPTPPEFPRQFGQIRKRPL